MENLEKLLTMRVRYFFSILSDAQLSLPEFKLNVSEQIRALTLEIAEEVAKPKTEQMMHLRDALAGYDAILPPSTWVSAWVEALTPLSSQFSSVSRIC